MIEAYKISVNMTLTGDAHKKMMEFSRLVEKTSKQMENFLRHLKGLGTTFISFNAEARSGTRAIREFDLGLTSTARHAAQANTQVTKLKQSVRQLNAVQKQGGGSGGGGGAGFGIGAVAGYLGKRFAPGYLGYKAFGLGVSSFETGKEYENKLSQLSFQGYSPAQIKNIESFVQSQAIPGVSDVNMMESYVDALQATRDVGKAKFLAPKLAKGQLVAKGTFGGMTHGQQQEAIRFAEYRGRGDEKRIAEQLELAMQMISLSGGSINPAQLALFAKYGGNAATRLSNEAIIGMEPIMQMLKGSSFGTGLQTGFLQLSRAEVAATGTGANKRLAEWRRVGLLNKKGGAEQFQQDPFLYMQQSLLPALNKAGIKTPEAIEKEMGILFERTTARIFVEMFENQEKIMRVRHQAGYLKKGDAMYEEFMKTRSGAESRLEASWTNLKKAIDEFNHPAVLAGINNVARFLDHLTIVLRVLSNTGNEQTPGFKRGMEKITNASSEHLNPFVFKDRGTTNTGLKYTPINVNVKAQVKEKTLWEVVWQSRFMGNNMQQDGTSAVNIGLGGASNALSNPTGTFSQ